MVYSTTRFKAVVMVLVLNLLLCGLFYEAICFISLALSYCCLSIAITSLREERANLSAFRMFVQFALIWYCLFPLPLDVWKGLRFVILALPGLFSYLFWEDSSLAVPGSSFIPLCMSSVAHVQRCYAHRKQFGKWPPFSFHLRDNREPYLSLAKLRDYREQYCNLAKL